MTTIIEGVKGNIELLSGNYIYLVVMFILMSIASFLDLKYMKIYNKFNKTALMLRVIALFLKPITTMDILGAAIIFGLMLVIGIMNVNKDLTVKNDIGGDIKYSGVFALWTGPYLACSSFLIGLLLMSPISLIKRKNVPLAPFLQIGLIINFVLYFFVLK